MTHTKDTDAIKWAAQVVTFYRPSFWNVDDDQELLDYVAKSPEAFWNRLLDSVAEAKLDYVEFCFEPGDWKTALKAYGSPENLVESLASRNLKLSGSYQSGWDLEKGIVDASARTEIMENARRHSEFLAACGTGIMLSGPTRRGEMEGSIFPQVSDASLASTAEIMSEMAEITRSFGVRLAIHTEAYSCICREDDIDRVMEMTEPGLVFLCPDSGHIALDGGNPVNVVAKHVARMTSMHWKDCIGERSNLPANGSVTHHEMMEQFRRMGKGIVDWTGVVEAMRDQGFTGFAAAEIDLAEDPIGDTRDIVDYFETKLSKIYR